ncbi:alpha/beta fold hydrolase [Deinococcus yavapaiensis]|uniref:Pimeloyl-ACP methyl ester carboxylesterase n=1 Tax=Deinococcus yavapaiensis KR-236 TaxID=694435 RepID=A0A318S3X0_9DEIO|nr:alpha/beta hydrolase [Deinococcus yavapaiensis]PYE53235.1 pimeloyl-ACP methyl ester carboxylesterase [Deinococcus yavapaiensis KR-236]
MTTNHASTQTVTSHDGTRIAFDRSGTGSPVILVSGGSVDHASTAPVAALLSTHFTVYNLHRRGRGASGDTAPYAVKREVEDIEAVLDAAGGSACLWGSSSGAVLALEAARLLPGKIRKLALWEPPFVLDPARRPPADTARTFHDLVAQGRRGDAAEYFMKDVVGLPPEFVANARRQPWWPRQEALAHTLEYDATIMGDYGLPEERVRQVSTPTLVLDGGASFAFIQEAARAVAERLQNGQYRTLEGQTHDVDAKILAPALQEFFDT